MTDKMPELKACPFCGSNAFEDEAGFGQFVNVCCQNEQCELRGIAMSRSTWNTRAPLTEPVIDDGLREAIHKKLMEMSHLLSMEDTRALGEDLMEVIAHASEKKVPFTEDADPKKLAKLKELLDRPMPWEPAELTVEHFRGELATHNDPLEQAKYIAYYYPNGIKIIDGGA